MPNLYLIGGPNGAGKTTVAFRLFPDILHSKEFVNADFIAKGLSAFDTESVAIAAGRLMVERIHELRSKRKDFALRQRWRRDLLFSLSKSARRMHISSR
jgi:predicted ABC-type ATPase